MKPKCRVCGKTAQGLYGWKAKNALVKADLCAEHARELRAQTGVVVLRNHRGSILRPMKRVHAAKNLAPLSSPDVLDVIAGLPEGHRTKADIEG